jgi:signal transduction histidine kinase
MNKVLQVGQLQVFEYQLIHEEHMYDFEVRLVSNGADEMLALQRNITEQKKIERRKNEFISVVSHELRTPLTSIHGSLGVLVGGVAGEVSAPVKTMLELAYRNSQRLIRLINDILDIEKLTFSGLELKLQPLELLAVLQEAVTDCQPYARQFGVRFILEEQKELLPKLIVQADRERLIQVLDNLLSNAAKFSPPAGMVEVSAFLAQQGKLVRVTVSDHGSGIPLEFQKHIFEKFTQADASDKRYKGGTGLGLSIAKALVEKHGGQIGFETAKGQGTTFYFDLPLLSPLLLD